MCFDRCKFKIFHKGFCSFSSALNAKAYNAASAVGHIFFCCFVIAVAHKHALCVHGHIAFAAIGQVRGVVLQFKGEALRQAAAGVHVAPEYQFGGAAHGLTIDPELDYATVYFSPEGGCTGATELLRRGRKFTAIFTMSDLMAIGAFRALKDRGLDVPKDVTVIGFDGLPVGEYLVPRLSTVEQPAPAMARKGLELLLDAIENGTEARHETVPFTLLYRESTGPAKG